MRVWLTGLLLLVFSASLAYAQPRTSLGGIVRDAATGESLFQATVRFEGTAIGAATNVSGVYALTGFTPGTYTIVASYIGYQDFRLERTFRAGEQVRLDIELSPRAEDLDEVVISAEAQRLEEARRVGTAQISTALIRQLPAVFEPDVFRSLQLLPGIKAISDFSSGLYIRGGSPDQTLILLDRTTVYNPTHFFGFFSTFNPDAIKDVRVYKGGFPAEYGGRLGSVVDIYNKDGNRRRHAGTATVGLLASRAMVEGPVGRGSYMVAGRRSTLEPLFAALKSADVEGLPEKFYFYDINGKLNFDATPRDLLSLSFYAGQDKVIIPFLDNTAKADLLYGNVTGSLTYRRLFSNQLFGTATVTASRYFSDPSILVAATQFDSRTRITDYSLKTDVEYVPSQEWSAKAGFWTGYFDFDFKRSFNNEVNFSPKIGSLYGSAYFQQRFRPNPYWEFEGGVRVQGFRAGNYVRVEPRFTLESRPYGTNALRLQLGYGRYYQFLTLITSEVFSGSDFWLTAAEGVPPAYGDQFVAGIKTRPTRTLTLDVDLYYRTMRDLFEIDPFVQDPAGLEYADFFRFGEGYAMGVEVQLEGQIGRVNGLLGYTLATTRRRFPDFPRPAPDDFTFYPPKYDRLNDLNLVLNYDLSRAWRFTSVFTYGTGQAYTEVYARVRLPNDPFSSPRLPTEAFQTEYNASRLPAYHRLDMGFQRRGRFWRDLGDYELNLQVINAYNRKNVWFYFPRQDRETNTTERIRVSQLPVPLPNFSFTLTW